MKFLSFNCRGLVSPSKELALKIFVESIDPKSIFQEALDDSVSIKECLKSFLKGWPFEALDARGGLGRDSF